MPIRYPWKFESEALCVKDEFRQNFPRTAAAVSSDPYDLWSLPIFGKFKSLWYSGNKLALFPIGVIYFFDLVFPVAMRRAFGCAGRNYIQVHALLQRTELKTSDSCFVDHAHAARHENGWGHGFSWYSANGLYDARTPFITVTPYVMAALCAIHEESTSKAEAHHLFLDTWVFLESLPVMYEDAELLALSYSPEEERYTVINANSYAAWAYAMHSRFNAEIDRDLCLQRLEKIINWISKNQNEDGSWFYLSERTNIDMIDGFHSCFVVRNLMYISDLVPEFADKIKPMVTRGWRYIKSELFDQKKCLAKRYSQIKRLDPFRYDLYDQAEMLMLYSMMGDYDDGAKLLKSTRETFTCRDAWFSRIDLAGSRRYPKYLRWGLAQFIVAEAEFLAASQNTSEEK